MAGVDLLAQVAEALVSVQAVAVAQAASQLELLVVVLAQETALGQC